MAHTAFTAVFQHRKLKLDLSSMQWDGSHTLCRQGEEAVGYQGRKKGKTTNVLCLADNGPDAHARSRSKKAVCIFSQSG
jgi:hypothetical protein